MEQLIRRDEQTSGRMIEVAMLMKKVEIRLSKEQLASLGRIMSSYLANLKLRDIDDKAIFYLVYGVYESKIRKKMFSLKQDMKISLDVAQAWAITAMLQDIDISDWKYEDSIAQFIILEINHQTA